MNSSITKPYNSCLSHVKALMAETNTEVHGFYFEKDKERFVYNPESQLSIKINPYTVCRNSGIKDKNGIYIYEYDLLKLTHGLTSSCYGFLVWDEFYKSWKIRRRTDMSAYNSANWIIETVGNIILNDADAEIIFQQEREEDNKPTFIDNSYCPSKFKK